MVNKLKKKVSKKNGGFTLAELLIVVAIIAVLAIIAIPIFSAKLENSREETDIANLRSAKAAAVAQYLSGTELDGKTPISSEGFSCFYDANSGTLVQNNMNVKRAYGRGTASKGGCESFDLNVNPTKESTIGTYTEDSVVAGLIIHIKIFDTGEIELKWVEP